MLVQIVVHTLPRPCPFSTLRSDPMLSFLGFVYSLGILITELIALITGKVAWIYTMQLAELELNLNSRACHVGAPRVGTGGVSTP